ncbi:hypothetical protein DF117_27875 [Burkholderia stagnalis]|nr:hypothetical protein DF119_22510 [Burkholderia stagnalis]RQY14938.1 hypothetical protein DF117_27875 [Burkholderia stagnalis]RQY32515.1 hypothetical protein DF116_26765 [Burkholderia stagnalis]RQY49590.1 hypothetical protein DF112_23130 [Burkholderia stagnalis]RQY56613.1 hypothetical protein DF111_12450 [Burkholderia stagnalis]
MLSPLGTGGEASHALIVVERTEQLDEKRVGPVSDQAFDGDRRLSGSVGSVSSGRCEGQDRGEFLLCVG